MQRTSVYIISALLLLVGVVKANAQDDVPWTLRHCIDYARENNLQVQQAVLQMHNAEEALLQAKASTAPSLSAYTNQTLSFSRAPEDDYSVKGLYSGDYGLSTSMTVWSGGRIRDNRLLQELNCQIGELDILTARNSIEISVTLAYLNILYAQEAVATTQNTLEASRAQAERARQMLSEGAISMSDCAQFEAQHTSDEYNLTEQCGNLSECILNLKQLLEIGLGQKFEVDFPCLGDDDVLKAVPDIESVYKNACKMMPDMKAAALDVDAAGLSEKMARAAMMPTISASASLGTMNVSDTNTEFLTQLGRQVNGAVGVTLSIPILDSRSARTSYNKAKLATRSAQLSLRNAQKDMLATIESLHQDVVNAQSRYLAAKQKLKSAEESYNLQCEKFNEGMINAVDLLTEKNTYTAAQQELNQSKYQAILSAKLLDFYLGYPINL